jgi:Domain of unknown function (DUF4372)
VKKRYTKPTACKLSVLGQLCKLIAPHLVSKLARETGVDSMARSFSAWSHVVSMLFAQLTHAIGLNDVCYSFTVVDCHHLLFTDIPALACIFSRLV